MLDDETNQLLANTEVIVLNYGDLNDYPFKTNSHGRLIFEYPYVGAKPMLQFELRKNGYVPLRHAWGPAPGSSPVVDALAIRLRRGTTMGGIDEQGHPIEGAEVVDSTGGFTFLKYVRRAFMDREGRFHFHLPRGGDISVTAWPGARPPRR